jgi:hypothetical protein
MPPCLSFNNSLASKFDARELGALGNQVFIYL